MQLAAAAAKQGLVLEACVAVGVSGQQAASDPRQDTTSVYLHRGAPAMASAAAGTRPTVVVRQCICMQPRQYGSAAYACEQRTGVLVHYEQHVLAATCDRDTGSSAWPTAVPFCR
mmetsp:Transcript_16381/g.48816  ORF Transcript_16381/g.48816 Transcript_16381/m.48816 type:complete len:115 (-) Transcript_16381:212-556(-)